MDGWRDGTVRRASSGRRRLDRAWSQLKRSSDQTRRMRNLHRDGAGPRSALRQQGPRRAPRRGVACMPRPSSRRARPCTKCPVQRAAPRAAGDARHRPLPSSALQGTSREAPALDSRHVAPRRVVASPVGTSTLGCWAGVAHLGISGAAIAAIGELPDHVFMFRESGLSIAMGHARAVVQRQARFITLSNDDEGFAHAVETWLLTASGGQRGRGRTSP
ncbi:HAD family hydrolase [Sorangium sp. So ce693]|uniref:HAD family hydrolase n=1 Tax=Sorangium sp. So ce693 TaxID=3133318 RepID=UPI003F647678